MQRSRCIGEVWIYGYVPRVKQPFWNVEPVSVSLAPVAELSREDIRLDRESQLPDLQFELGRNTGAGRMGRPQLGLPRL